MTSKIRNIFNSEQGNSVYSTPLTTNRATNSFQCLNVKKFDATNTNILNETPKDSINDSETSCYCAKVPKDDKVNIPFVNALNWSGEILYAMRINSSKKNIPQTEAEEHSSSEAWKHLNSMQTSEDEGFFTANDPTSLVNCSNANTTRFKGGTDNIPTWHVHDPYMNVIAKNCISRVKINNSHIPKTLGRPVGVLYAKNTNLNNYKQEKLFAAYLKALALIYLQDISLWIPNDLDLLLTEAEDLLTTAAAEGIDLKNSEAYSEIETKVKRKFQLRNYSFHIELEQAKWKCNLNKNLYKSLKNFFRYNKYCLIQFKNWYILCCKDRHKYIILDLNGREKQTLRSNAINNKYSVMICVKKLINLIHLIINMSDLAAHEQFLIRKILVAEVVTPEGKVYSTEYGARQPEYQIVNDSYAFLLSNLHLSLNPDETKRNRSALVVAIAAMVASKIDHTATWNTRMLDKVICFGVNSYRWICANCSKLCNSPLNLTTFPRCMHIGQFLVSYELDAAAYTGKWHCGPIQKFSEFRLALQTALEQNEHIIFQINQNQMYAIWKKHGFYYLLDPYLHKVWGLESAASKAKVASIRMLRSFNTLVKVFHHILLQSNRATTFHIHTFDITNLVKNLKYKEHVTLSGKSEDVASLNEYICFHEDYLDCLNELGRDSDYELDNLSDVSSVHSIETSDMPIEEEDEDEETETIESTDTSSIELKVKAQQRSFSINKSSKSKKNCNKTTNNEKQVKVTVISQKEKCRRKSNKIFKQHQLKQKISCLSHTSYNLNAVCSRISVKVSNATDSHRNETVGSIAHANVNEAVGSTSNANVNEAVGSTSNANINEKLDSAVMEKKSSLSIIKNKSTVSKKVSYDAIDLPKKPSKKFAPRDSLIIAHKHIDELHATTPPKTEEKVSEKPIIDNTLHKVRTRQIKLNVEIRKQNELLQQIYKQNIIADNTSLCNLCNLFKPEQVDQGEINQQITPPMSFLRYPTHTQEAVELVISHTHTGSYQSICKILKVGLKCVDRVLITTALGNFVVFRGYDFMEDIFFVYCGCTCDINRFRYMNLMQGTAGLKPFSNLHNVICYMLNPKREYAIYSKRNICARCNQNIPI